LPSNCYLFEITCIIQLIVYYIITNEDKFMEGYNMFILFLFLSFFSIILIFSVFGYKDKIKSLEETIKTLEKQNSQLKGKHNYFTDKF
jgi:cell division protein FtsB